MKVPILPADSYVVVNKTILRNEDRKIVTLLYQPIIGYSAVSLYFTLIDDLDKRELMSEDFTHHHLMNVMQLSLNEIVIARQKLEAVGLIKTYLKKDHINNYVYLLYSPLSASDFLNHPILNVVLYQNIGKKEYDHIVNYFKVPRINLKDYEDVTSSFHEVFTSVSGSEFIENEDIVKEARNNLVLESKIDFDLLVASIPKSMVNERCFSEEVKELITNLSFVYNIDEVHMQGLVRDHLNEKGLVDKMALRKACRNFYQFEEGGKLPTLIYTMQPNYLKSPKGDESAWAKMVYQFESMTPYDFLASKYKNGEPSLRDLKLVESILVDTGLRPGVVNALLDYVLKVNNQKLSKAYIDTIAGQLARLNVETVEDAMKVIEKEHKKLARKYKNSKEKTKEVKYTNPIMKEKVPEWFDKELKETKMDEASRQEMEDLLKPFSDH